MNSSATPSTSGSAPTTKPLRELLLDPNNPRFGMDKGNRTSQVDILDYIVDNFGVDDLLSSISYNDYFPTEPLIVRQKASGESIVMEGNRRLAACLILANDDRARNQARRIESFRTAAIAEKWSVDTPVPVQIFSETDDMSRLHAYLGVRHILSVKAWDSYAKASWIDDVITRNEMTLEQICEVTGDKNRTIQRLLEGFYFVNQLRDARRFIPENSVRRGRGSNPEFPFSWVYTLLDAPAVREWLDFDEGRATNKKPIKAHRIDDAASVMTYMFGDRAQGINAAVSDSRELGKLANALSDPQRRHWLARGRTVSEIEELTRNPIDRLTHAIEGAFEHLSTGLSIATTGEFSEGDRHDLERRAKDVAALARQLWKQIQSNEQDLEIE